MKHPVVHFEIMGKDTPKLRDFYTEVFGWDVAAPTENGTTEYSIVQPVPHFQRGINGGIGKAPEGYDGHVTFYVVVDDVEEALMKVESRGGSRMMGPDEVPNGPTIGLFKDPEGHTVGVVDPGEEMTGGPMDLEPFVFFYGRCAEALEFYKKVLGGSYEIMMRDGDTVHYASYSGPGISFKAADGTNKAGSSIDPDAGNISLALNVPSASGAAQIFAALSEGGKRMHEFGDVEWGGKFGALYDRFGNEWFVTAP